jgi:hypothetical protein
MKLLIKMSVIIGLALLFNSCDSELTLQKFYVESEKNNNYLMMDLPTSILTLNDNASEKAKLGLESVHKLNLLAFKLNDTNDASYIEEKTKVKAILANKDYTELVRFNESGRKVIIKFLGTSDSIDEVIVYGNDKTMGFGLARLLGDNMTVENMLALMESLKNLDQNSDTFKKLEGFFGSK